jgi:carbonic anhydrase
VILHHTDCGIRRLAAFPEQLAAFFEIPAEELEGKAVDDPYAAVAALRKEPATADDVSCR